MTQRRLNETQLTSSNEPERNSGADLPWAIEMRDPRSLRPSPRNARTHSKKQIKQLARSMAAFGVMVPIIVDPHDVIIAGYARTLAAIDIGLRKVPVAQVSHLSDAQIRAYMLADNRIAQNAGWDRETLAQEFADLQIELADIELDLSITGFEPAEVDSILVDLGDDHDATDDVPPLGSVAVARQGDLFALGGHRLIVGDARDRSTYDKLMNGTAAQMAFVDPPYNVPIQGHVGGRGRTKHREFACAAGEMTTTEFTAFLTESFRGTAACLTDGAIAFVRMDWRHLREVLDAGSAVFSALKNMCVWDKKTPGQGSFYRSQHELVFAFKHGEAPHINTFELGQHGRTRSNVWSYPGVNAFRAGRMDELRMHPTLKPVALIADAMRDCSHRGSIILDSFAGAGSSITAAEQVGRRAFCIELDPLYVDCAIRRWQKLTGKDAILVSGGETFNELEESRCRDGQAAESGHAAYQEDKNRPETGSSTASSLATARLKPPRSASSNVTKAKMANQRRTAGRRAPEPVGD